MKNMSAGFAYVILAVILLLQLSSISFSQDISETAISEGALELLNNEILVAGETGVWTEGMAESVSEEPEFFEINGEQFIRQFIREEVMINEEEGISATIVIEMVGAQSGGGGENGMGEPDAPRPSGHTCKLGTGYDSNWYITGQTDVICPGEKPHCGQEWTNFDGGFTTTWSWYSPDGSLSCDHSIYIKSATDVYGSGYYWKWYRAVGWLNGATTPGRWHVRCSGGGNCTKYFTIKYQLADHTMCKSSNGSSRTTQFNSDDYAAYNWLKVNDLTFGASIEWKWYYPNGSLYTTASARWPSPSGRYHSSATANCKMYIAGHSPENYGGNWKVKTYVDGDYQYTDTFNIEVLTQYDADLRDIWLDPSASDLEVGDSGRVYAQYKNTSDLSTTLDARIIVRKPDGSSTYAYIDNWSFSYNQVKNLYWAGYSYNQEGQYTVTAEIYDSQGKQSDWSSSHRYDSRTEHFTVDAPAYDAEVRDIWTVPDSLTEGDRGRVYAKYQNLSPTSGTFDARITVREPSGSSTYAYIDNWDFSTNQSRNLYWDNYDFDEDGTYTVIADIYDNQGRESSWSSSHHYDSRTESFNVSGIPEDLFNASVEDVWIGTDGLKPGERGDVRACFKNLSRLDGPYGGEATFDARIIVVKPDNSRTYGYIDNWAFGASQALNLLRPRYHFDQSGDYTLIAEIYDIGGLQANWDNANFFDRSSRTINVSWVATPTPGGPSPTPAYSPLPTPPGQQQQSLDLGPVTIYADYITDGSWPKMASGHVNIDNIVKANGDIRVDRSGVVYSISGSGRLYLEDIPVPGMGTVPELTIYNGAFSYEVDGNGLTKKYLNRSLEYLKVAGLDAQIRTISILSDGVELSADLKIPGKSTSIEVGRLRVTRSGGLSITGKLGIAGVDIEVDDLDITSNKLTLNYGKIVFPDAFSQDGISFSPASRSYTPLNDSCSEFDFTAVLGVNSSTQSVECSDGVWDEVGEIRGFTGTIEASGVEYGGDYVVFLSRSPSTEENEEIIDLSVVDSSGSYDFEELPPGEYRVRFSGRVTVEIEGLEISSSGFHLKYGEISNIPELEYAGIKLTVGSLGFSNTPLGISLNETSIVLPSAMGGGTIYLGLLNITEDGIDIDGAIRNFTFTIPGSGFKITIEEIYFDTVRDQFGGMGKLSIPAFPDIRVGVGFNKRELSWIHAEVQEMNIPIYAVIFLQRISLDINNLENGPPAPVIVGAVGISAGPTWPIPGMNESVVLLGADPIALTIDTSDYVELSGELTLFKPSSGTMEGNISFLLWDWEYNFSGFNVLKALCQMSRTRGFTVEAYLNIIDILKESATFNIDRRWNVSGRGRGSIGVPSYIPVIGGYELGGFETVLTNDYLAGEGWVTSLLSLAAKFNFDGEIEFGKNLNNLGVTNIPASVLMSYATSSDFAVSPSSAVDVPGGLKRAIFRFAWSDQAATEVRIISPTGEEFSPSDAPLDSPYANYLLDQENREAWYVVKDPEEGQWRFMLSNRSIGDLTVQLLNIEDAPEVEMSSPGPQVLSGVKTNGDTIRLAWSFDDIKGDEMISLYYDTDESGYDGSLIASGRWVSRGYYDWAIDDDIPSGRYFVYAIINNGNNLPRGSYMPGLVTVENGNAPDSPRNVAVESGEGEITITWDANVEEDLLAYVVEWTDDVTSINFDHRLAVGTLTSCNLDQLDNGRTYKIAVKAVDIDGNESLSSEVILVQVNVAGDNHSPVIISKPKTMARQGVLYQYQISVSDIDDDDTLTYLLEANPEGMTIGKDTGLIDWMPGVTDVGQVKVVIKVKDGLGYEDTQDYYLDVYNDYMVNIAPEIISNPPSMAELNQIYTYQLDVFDVDEDEFTCELLHGPEGMTISGDGLMQWTPTSENSAGENLVEIKVTDGRGGKAVQSFNIFLKWFSAYDAEALDIWLDPDGLKSGESSAIYAQFKNTSDEDGPYDGAATLDARIVVRKPDGSSTYGYIDDWSYNAAQVKDLKWSDYTFDQAGQYKITAQIYDIGGRQSGWSWWNRFDSKSEYFTVAQGATPPPTVPPTPRPPTPTPPPPGDYPDIRVSPLSLTFNYDELPGINRSSPLRGSTTSEFRISNSTLSLSLDITTVPYNLIQSDGYTAFEIEGYDLSTSPGDPAMPHKVYRILIPPEADESTIKIKITEVDQLDLEGEYEVEAAPPFATWDGSKVVYVWGEDKRIVDGRNLNVYDADDDYPILPAKIISSGSLRKWKFVEVDIRPFVYSPVRKKLTYIRKIKVEVFYQEKSVKRGVRLSTLMSDTVMDEDAARLFDNFSQAAEWYKPKKQLQSKTQVDRYDYVIITSNAIESHSSKLDDFVAHKENLGFKVKVVTEDEFGSLSGQSPNGRAEKIRRWLQDNYAAMGIKYVLLVGDPRTDSSDIPMKMCWPRRNQTWETSYKDGPTDYYYADLTGNWDKDGDGYFGESGDDTGSGGVDRAAEVIVGRIPVYNSDYSSLDSILQKTINYETASGDLSWRDRILLPMEPSDGNTPGWQLGEGIKNNYANPRGFASFRIYEQDYGIDPVPEKTPCNATNVQNEWENGYGLVTWWTHGSPTSASDIFSSYRSSNLDDTKPAIVFQNSCLNGEPETTNNLGYSLLKNGAIGTISASRVSWYNPGTWNRNGSNSDMAYKYSAKVLEGRSTGDALFDMKINESASGAEYWMNHLVFNLYGDPSIVLASAQNITIYNDGDQPLTVNGITKENGSSWLKVVGGDLLPLSIEPGGSKIITVRVDRDGVDSGTYNDRLLISSDDPGKSPYPGAVYVTMKITSAGEPDLIIDPPSPDDGFSDPPFAIGQEIDWFVNLYNVGDGDAGSSSLGYYLGVSSSDYSHRIISAEINSLGAGGSSISHNKYAFTQSDRGTRYLNVFADRNDQIGEKYENNNKASYGPFQVGPDFTPTPKPTVTVVPETPTPVPTATLRVVTPTVTPYCPTPPPTPKPPPTMTPAPPDKVPHTVMGRVFNSNGTASVRLNFAAHIVTRPEDVINHESTGSGYENSWWQINVGNFEDGWSIGEKLHLNFLNPYNGASGSWEYILTGDDPEEMEDYYLESGLKESIHLRTTSGTNVNAITLIDVEGVVNAEDLAGKIPNCKVIYRWNPEEQCYEGHVKGLPIGNFEVKPYYPYFVSVNAPGVWTQTGDASDLPYYHLITSTGKTNVNAIVFPADLLTLKNAEELAQDIPNCKVIYRWNAEEQCYDGHVKGLPMNNFKIRAWEPYFISVDAESYWP